MLISVTQYGFCKAVENLRNLVFGCPILFCLTLNITRIVKHKHLHKITIKPTPWLFHYLHSEPRKITVNSIKKCSKRTKPMVG